jgi:hypothetical protein
LNISRRDTISLKNLTLKKYCRIAQAQLYLANIGDMLLYIMFCLYGEKRLPLKLKTSYLIEVRQIENFMNRFQKRAGVTGLMSVIYPSPAHN